MLVTCPPLCTIGMRLQPSRRDVLCGPAAHPLVNWRMTGVGSRKGWLYSDYCNTGIATTKTTTCYLTTYLQCYVTTF